MLKQGVLIVLSLVACVGVDALSQQDAEEKAGMQVQAGEPIVVAQTDKARHPWGVWQFPAIRQVKKGVLEVTFSRTVDNASLDTAKKRHPPVAFISSDNGQTWQEAKKSLSSRNFCRLQDGGTIGLEMPAEMDIAKAKLPEGFPVDGGYNNVYTIRDPLQMPEEAVKYCLFRKQAGKDDWENIPAVMDDPDGGIICYDPPGAAHAVVRWWWCEQILEIPDNSLLAICYGYRLGQDRKPYPKFQSWCLKSTDGGESWHFHGVIARDDSHPIAGYPEPQVTVLPDGSLLAALRTECAKTGPMYRTRSTDGGKTWESPERLWPFGVLPQLLTLDNGVTVLAFGRPGVHLLFSHDGKGEKWGNPVHLVVESFEGTGIDGEGYGFQPGEAPKGRPKQTRTSGYTSLVATGPNSFMIAYDQFDYPNADGKPRKTILVRKFTVAPK
jgi:hypothetical protein